MLLSSYVASFDEIRALLGVDSEELSDDTIGLRVFLRSLEEGFNEIDEQMNQATGTLRAAYLDAEKTSNESRTDTQRRLFDNVQTYASYHVAVDLADSLPMMAPRSITDGKAAVQRFADAAFQLTISAVKAGKGRAIARLKRAYALTLGLTPTSSLATPGTLLTVSNPDADPVTGS